MQRLARAVPIAPHVTAYAVSVLAATHPDQPRAPGARPRLRPLRRLAARRPGARHRAARSTRCSTAASTSRSTTSGRSRCRRCATGSSSTSRARPRASRPRRSSASILDAVVAADRRVAPRPRGDRARWTVPDAAQARRPPSGRPPAGRRPARARRSCPSEVDPTVFDEAFLRQLERLLLLMRSPVRGGLKGGRRSVKRGQSVEFADYRDYTLGDDLRQLDWNVYARLEKLFVKLFVEEEDVTVTLLIDASASMAGGTPGQAPVREAGGGGARLHRARERGPRRGQRAGRPDRPAAGGDARLGPGLPAAGRPVGDRARRRPDRPRRRGPPRRRPAPRPRRRRSCSPTCSTRPPTRSSASSRRRARS